MDMELTDRIVIVTGGLAGINAAISRRLVIEGAIPVFDAPRRSASGSLHATRWSAA